MPEDERHVDLALRERIAKLTAALATADLDTAELQRSHVVAEENLRRAIESRDLIGQAKGLLMAKTGCSGDDAFDLLVAQSQHQNRKIVELASEFIEQHNRLARTTTHARGSSLANDRRRERRGSDRGDAVGG